VTKHSESRIADNVVLFCRTLRKAGLPVGPGQVIEAAQAILATGIQRRDDFRVALRTVLVKDPSQRRVFDQAFHIYFRNPRLLERMMALMLPTLEQIGSAEPSSTDTAIRRLLEAMATSSRRDDEDAILEIDYAGSWSPSEVLRQKDFEQMSLDEQRQARQILRDAQHLFRAVPTRRFRASPRGRRIDVRRTARQMFRNNGQLVELATRRRYSRPPTLVLLCDISGSMSGYSRMFLHFAHALSASAQTVHSFVFGTRLTNISHWLDDRDVDRALTRVSGEVEDWDGGTRITECLRRFNVDWGRRVLAGRSIVILLSDGLERQSVSELGFEMARLRRTTDELIWLNPMLRYEQFEPRAQGIRAMLPHVDRFLPAHNIASLTDLADRLSGRHRYGAVA
jgi:uncharacterized protein with von Willebrand factor type A (vWA) domain